MPNVVFSDSYFITGVGQSSQNVRVNYSETYSDSANASTIRITSIEIAADRQLGGCVIRGDLYINGTLMVSMPTGTSSYTATIPGGLSSYATVANASGGSVSVAHNAEGAAAMTVELRNGEQSIFGAAFSGHMFGVRTTASKSVSLTTRPRASTIASSTSSVNTLGTYALTMSRAASTYYHIATFRYNNSTTLYTSGRFDTSLSFTVPRTWFSNYGSRTSLPITVSVQTYSSSGTAVGSPATVSLTVKADANMKPVVSGGWATFAPYNTGAVSGMTGYVQGYSRAQVTFNTAKISMTNAVGASIASYSVTCQGSTVSASPYRTPVLASTSVSAVCTVTDTRGRSASTTFTLTPMAYARPRLSAVSIFRCNASGTASEDGTKYSAKATLTYSSLNGQNPATLVCAVAAAGGSYGSAETMRSGQAKISTANLSVDRSYTVRITATDTLGNTAVYYQTISSRKWAMKFRTDGNGVAFGKAAELDGTFEVASDWNVKFGRPLPIASGGTGANSAATARSNLQAAHLITPANLAGYGLSVNGSVYNFTLADLFSAVPGYSRVVIPWIKSQNTASFGALAGELPTNTTDYGMLTLEKSASIGEFRFIRYSTSITFHGSFTTVNSRGFNGWIEDKS